MPESVLQHLRLGRGPEFSTSPHAVYLTDKGLIALRRIAAIFATAKRPKMSKTQSAIVDALLELLGVDPATSKDE